MNHDLYAEMREIVLRTLKAVLEALPAPVPLDSEIEARIVVGPPREASHGDMVTNAAMVVATFGRRPPRELAAALAERLREVPGILEATPAGPGFVNLRLDPAVFRELLPGILRAGEAYGDSSIGAGTRINVEYVSANPTGPLHIGHCRGAVVGDALANLLAKIGHAVTKEYYINDAGAQVTALAWAAYWRYLQVIGTPLSEEDFSNEAIEGASDQFGVSALAIKSHLANHGIVEFDYL